MTGCGLTTAGRVTGSLTGASREPIIVPPTPSAITRQAARSLPFIRIRVYPAEGRSSCSNRGQRCNVERACTAPSAKTPRLPALWLRVTTSSGPQNSTSCSPTMPPPRDGTDTQFLAHRALAHLGAVVDVLILAARLGVDSIGNHQCRAAGGRPVVVVVLLDNSQCRTRRQGSSWPGGPVQSAHSRPPTYLHCGRWAPWRWRPPARPHPL